MNEMIERATPPVLASAPDVSDVIRLMVEKNLPPDALERGFALYERMQAMDAKQKFNGAMAKFAAECPPVPRRTENAQFQVTRAGTRQNRTYASLEDIAETIRAPLAANGLSYRWTGTDVKDGRLTMECVISHVGGHSESSPVVLPVESKAGCSEQQKYGTAMEYARRYSLIQALGLTSCDPDTDGNDESGGEVISDQQTADLAAMLDELGGDHKTRFLAWLGVSALSDIPAARFNEAKAALARKLTERK